MDMPKHVTQLATKVALDTCLLAIGGQDACCRQSILALIDTPLPDHAVVCLDDVLNHEDDGSKAATQTTKMFLDGFLRD